VDAAKAVVGVVIVSYFPDEANLVRLASVLGSQAACVLVVDNTPGGHAFSADAAARLNLLPLGENKGIAEAFNIGIARLLEQGCDYILLSDQDSLPQDSMVAGLLHAHQTLQAGGVKVAAVGAEYIDPRNGRAQGFPRVHWRGIRVSHDADATGFVPCTFLISSGCLIARDTLQALGLMESGLFIDTVDMEWCYRAAAKGHLSYGVPGACMAHTIGDHTVDFWFLGQRCNPVHSPFRVYFQFRNFMALLARTYIPFDCKIWLIQNRLVLAYMYLFIVPAPKRPYIRSMVRGLWHGLLGRKGGLAA